MAGEDLQELKALLVGFLQQTLKDFPNGVSIYDLERKLPDACDEPKDWYKRYNKKSALEACECINDTLNVRYRNGVPHISLNMASESVDHDLVDLITHQKSNKRKFARPSHNHLASRARNSFSLNRQFSGGHSRKSYHQPARLNYDQQYRGDQFIRTRYEQPSPAVTSVSRPPSIYNSSPSTTRWIASNDPRQRAAASPMIPPQVRPHHHQQQQPTTPSKPPMAAVPPVTQPPQPVVSQTSKLPTAIGASSIVGRHQAAPISPVQQQDDNPEMVAKKNHLRQRLVSLLMRRSAEVKIFHLSGLYQIEFSDELDSKAYGHTSLATLLKDPIISEFIQVNFKSPFATISIRPKLQSSDKENVQTPNGVTAPSTKDKLNAVDPFNVKPMLQSLEPLGQIKEPPMRNFEIDDIVKYKTMRLVFKSKESALKLDDWEIRFEQENRLRIRIRDYGCRTVLEFFQRLARDIPIIVEQKEEQWVAVADLEKLRSTWLKERFEGNNFRAITAIDARYELISFPDDSYTFTDVKDILHSAYQPAHILSVKRADSMWIQLRTPKRIEDQLCVEASLTCYEDFDAKKLLTPPRAFIRPGFPCAVKDEHMERWCRGLVLKKERRGDEFEANVLLVDYGLERTYAISKMNCLMKTHLKYPVGSIYSKLHGVHDVNSISVQRKAKMILQEYTNPPVTLACKFLGSAAAPKNPTYLPSMCAEVILVDTRQGKDCNLADDINIPRELDEANDSLTPPDHTVMSIPITIQ